MLRTCILSLLLMFSCTKALADISVELDVVFLRRADGSTVQYRYLYVLSPIADGTKDTIAVFDTLSFIGKNRLSLFYTMPSSGGKNILSIVDSANLRIESSPFRVSPKRTTFLVAVGQQQIDITGKDFLYLRKNEDEQSYFVFLLIFFVAKFLIITIYIFIVKLPKRIISIASGAFLLSGFIDWFVPLSYLYRFLTLMLVEYLLIALVGRKSISWLQAAILIFVVNMACTGIIASLYLLYVFW